jgi:hypothetical protein
MKTIIRRLRRLEDRFGPAVETESDRQLLARIEAGRRRLAKAKERGEWCGSIDNGEREDFAGLSVVEILQRGRERVAKGVPCLGCGEQSTPLCEAARAR